MSAVAALLLSYLVASGAIYLACARFLRTPPPQRMRLLVLCAGLGPIAISRVLSAWYRLIPGLADSTYILLCGLVFAALALYGARGAQSLPLPSWGVSGTRRCGVALAAAGTGIAIATVLFTTNALHGVLQRAYAAYGARWQPSGTWWQGSLTDWGAALLLAAIACAAATGLIGKAGRVEPSGDGILRSAIVVVLGAACVAVVASALMLALGRPVYENDAVQYLKVATLMYERQTVAFYPLMPAVPGDGTWASSAHPLGHYAMLIWTFLLGGASLPGPAKLVPLTHAVMLAAAIALLAARFGPIAALTAALVWLTTPAVFIQTVGLGIDMPRLFLLLLAVVWLCEACRRGGWREYAAAGFCMGMCIYCHVLNALAGAIAVAAVVVSMPMGLRDRVTAAAVVTSIAVVVGGEQYLLNWIHLGSPIYDWQPLWDLVPSLDYLGWRTAMLASNDIWSRLAAGPFLGFARWYEWGIAWWIGSAALLFMLRELRRHDVMRAGLVSLAIFLLALFAYYGFHPQGGRYVLNYRYPMTVFPFVALAAGVWLGRLLDPRPASN
jgi:hypothetical protein